MSQIPPPCDVTKCDVTSHIVILAGEFTRCDKRDVMSLRRHFSKMSPRHLAYPRVKPS